GLNFGDGLLPAKSLFVAIENLFSRCELRCLRASAPRKQENYGGKLRQTHTAKTSQPAGVHGETLVNHIRFWRTQSSAAAWHAPRLPHHFSPHRLRHISADGRDKIL